MRLGALFTRLGFLHLKHHILLLYLFIICVSANAQRSYTAFDVLDGRTIVPPNGIRLNDSLFLDDAEVMNSNYLEYIHFLVQDSSLESVKKAYPDTTIFGSQHLQTLLKHKKEYYKKKGGKHVPVSTLIHDSIIHPVHHHHWWNYFSYHETRHFPVVGISYEQALAYCRWRSEFVTQHFNTQLKKERKYKAFKNMEVTFVFSLPSKEAWEQAAAGGLSVQEYPFGEKNIYGKDSLLNFNVAERKGNREPEFIYHNVPNAMGFYNMIGNVSEMIAEKGECKGGCYNTDLKHCQIPLSVPYHKAEKWIGFRCACVVKIKPKKE